MEWEKKWSTELKEATTTHKVHINYTWKCQPHCRIGSTLWQPYHMQKIVKTTWSPAQIKGKLAATAKTNVFDSTTSRIWNKKKACSNTSLNSLLMVLEFAFWNISKARGELYLQKRELTKGPETGEAKPCQRCVLKTCAVLHRDANVKKRCKEAKKAGVGPHRKKWECSLCSSIPSTSCKHLTRFQILPPQTHTPRIILFVFPTPPQLLLYPTAVYH